jgi:hypothetical protein
MEAGEDERYRMPTKKWIVKLTMETEECVFRIERLDSSSLSLRASTFRSRVLQTFPVKREREREREKG